MLINKSLRRQLISIAMVLTFWLLGSFVVRAQNTAADIVVYGNAITMDKAQPTATAIAIKGDRIVSVGDKNSLLPLIGPQTAIVTLDDGQILMPGLIEGHGHFLGLGHSLMMLRLGDAQTWDEITERVAEAAKVTPPGHWIVGRGWHQAKWTETPMPNVEGYPTTRKLDEAAPNHPVLLTHASGHMSIANSYAMRMAGIDSNTADPSGGELLRDAAGKPIGVFRETAQNLVEKAQANDESRLTPSQRATLTLKAIELAGNECLKNGITSFQDAGSSVPNTKFLRKLAIEEKLPVRLWVMLLDDNRLLASELPKLKAIGLGKEFFTCSAIKRSVDGALGPHGAWLLQPYQDLPTSTGLNTSTIESIAETAELAVTNGFQLCVHAIGDRANKEVLDLMESAFTTHPANQARRWRIEHAQHLAPDDIERFGKLGIIASMQGVHCTSDAIFVPQRLGNLRSKQGAYVWRSLWDSGAVVSNGTDAPVEDVNPFPSLSAMVSRRLKDGSQFFPEQCLTRMEALQTYTMNAAYAAFEESSKGSLTPGELADFIVLDKSPLECDESEISGIKVLQTFIGGKKVFESK